MAARKRSPKVKEKNGGRRPNSGRKPVEVHFDALNKRLDALDEAVTTILKHVLPTEASKISTTPSVGNGTDARQLSLYVPEPDESAEVQS